MTDWSHGILCPFEPEMGACIKCFIPRAKRDDREVIEYMSKEHTNMG